jgi:hypothetical protein
MILAIVLVIAAALSLIFIFGAVVSRGLQLSPRTNLSPKIQPLDLEAFRNLANPAEDRYLENHLPPRLFRAVRRSRLLTMIAYIQAASSNAAILIRLGQAAAASADPDTAKAAHQVVNDALLLRRNALYAMAWLYMALAWPDFGPGGETVIARYERMNGSAMLLGRLQNPARPVRLLAG